MPTYEYKCKKCSHQFEVFQSMRDDPLKVCPQCGGEIRRLINGGGGIIFKGSGFYVTDSAAERKSGSEAAAKPAADAKPAASSGTESGAAGKAATPAKAEGSASKPAAAAAASGGAPPSSA